jgi:hypothetical protein
MHIQKYGCRRIVLDTESALIPYSPGSARRPIELVGRETEIEAFDPLTAKIRQRRPDRGMVLHGLRGVGKTVPLNEVRGQAERADCMDVSQESRDGEAGPAGVGTKLARNLLQQDVDDSLIAAFSVHSTLPISGNGPSTLQTRAFRICPLCLANRVPMLNGCSTTAA